MHLKVLYIKLSVEKWIENGKIMWKYDRIIFFCWRNIIKTEVLKMKKDIAEKNPAIQAIIHRHASITDPDGSYTGRPENKYEKPVQDADDLQ